MKRYISNLLICLFLVFSVSVCFAGTGTPVEDLSRQVPDETIGFIAASGMDSVGPAFEKSTLGKVWADPQIQAILKGLQPHINKAIENEVADHPEKLEALNLFLRLGKVLIRRPVIAGAAINDSDAEYPVYGFAFVDAGEAEKEIREIAGEIEKLCPEIKIIKKQVGPCRMKAVEICEDVYVYWGWAGKKFVVAVNDDEGVLPKNIYWPSKDIAAGLDKIPQAGDALVIKYDFEKIQELIEKCVKKIDPKVHEKIVTMMEELGVTDMKTVAARIGFDGADVVAGEYVDLPAPRKGLFKSYGTIDLSQFALAEPQAMEACAFNIDLAVFYDILIKSIRTMVPEEQAGFVGDQIAAFEANSKFKIREGLLESIDGECMYYVVPAGAMIQAPGGGIVAILKLKDGKLFEENMAALGEFAAGKSNGMLQISAMPKGDNTIHSWTFMPLAMLQVMPCWAVSDGYAVLASNMFLCGKAIDRIGAGDPAVNSLLNNESFQTVVKGLPDELIALGYVDTKVQFRQMLAQLQRVWPMVSVAAMHNGMTLPAMLPMFEEAVKEMKPAARYSWFDGKGFYSSYTGSGIEISVGAVSGGAMGAAIMLPALGKAKQQAMWIVSARNLKAIGNACIIYAFDNEDKMPPNLEVLVDKAGICPGSLESKLKPGSFKGPSYIYVPGQVAGTEATNILIYENPAYLYDETTVFCLDGHVEKMKRERFIRELQATYQRLGKEMPQIKFRSDIEREKKQESKKTAVPEKVDAPKPVKEKSGDERPAEKKAEPSGPVQEKSALEEPEDVKPAESAASEVLAG